MQTTTNILTAWRTVAWDSYIGGIPRENSVDEHVDDEHGDDVVERETGLA